MMIFKKDNGIPYKMWLNKIEEGTLEQVNHLAQLPFAFKHIAIMPDAHQGYGMPIGGVLATKDYIIPNAVGVDIGCGMCAVKTSLTEIDTETLKKIMGGIRKAIPVGFAHHKEAQDEALMPTASETPIFSWDVANSIILKEYDNARTQIGTLGGGNHFIEIQKGSDGFIWIMIHSGSRNLGYTVANHYNKLAIKLNEMWHSKVPKEWELAYLPIDSEEGRNYINEMNYCVEFALANRKLMMEKITEEFYLATQNAQLITRADDFINIAHNYAALENHFGQNVWVHRKGATLAEVTNRGIIPGSQGTKSYITVGLSNPESFHSSSHGAGRKMGRKEAQKNLNLKDEIKKLDDKGIVHGVRNITDLDEAPGAYKDIDEVMNNQKDLVEVLVELTPLAVIKG